MRVVIDISEYDKEWIGNAYGIPQEINTKIAEAIINAEPCHPEPHWIPVEQDTPTEDDDYWATFEAKTGRFVDWASWYHGRWVVWIDGKPADISNVIAWQKSPEPYKGVTE